MGTKWWESILKIGDEDKPKTKKMVTPKPKKKGMSIDEVRARDRARGGFKKKNN